MGQLTSFAEALLTWADAHGDGLAAIAALIGIPLVLWQIFQGARHERARARARRYAALASLPMTLSAIGVWAKEVATALKAIYPWVFADRSQPTPEFKPPPSPDELIVAIERMIEAAPGDRIGKTLAAIVSDIQILNSRIHDKRDYRRENLRSQSGMIDHNLYLTARIYARTESLYDPARALSEDAPIDYSRMSSALNIMGIYEDQHRPQDFAAMPTVHKLITNEHQRALARRRGYEKVRDWIKGKFQAHAERKRRQEIARQMRANREQEEA